jgi:spastin
MTGDAKSTADFEAVSRSIVGQKSEGSATSRGASRAKSSANDDKGREWSDEWLRIADPDQLERIVPALEATIHRSNGNDALTRNDIAGLEFVKTQIEEVLILPQIHPELFASALTRPARGLLLFGPPGTGKTLLARWIAAECGATFFNINASSVLSKWIGEAEKTVKALFQLASERQPSVIFIDEIDSLLSQRRDADNESSRRVKNEFLTSLEGADTSAEEKVLLVGATNMPWELDHAALRRLPKRLYVPLPGRCARQALLERQLTKHNAKSGLASVLGASDITEVARRTTNFSGSDLQVLLNEAAMGPVREASAALGPALIKRATPGASHPVLEPRNINMQDFECALRRVKPSFSDDQAIKHREFNQEHGTCRGDDVMQDSEE